MTYCNRFQIQLFYLDVAQDPRLKSFLYFLHSQACWCHLCLGIKFSASFCLSILLLVPGSSCGIPPLNSEVIAMPTKAAYQIGERLSLSCPSGSMLEGEVSEIMCSPSLQWSPSPASAHCKAGTAHLFSVTNIVLKLHTFNRLFSVLRNKAIVTNFVNVPRKGCKGHGLY